MCHPHCRLLWAGLGASLAVACGSLCLLHCSGRGQVLAGDDSPDGSDGQSGQSGQSGEGHLSRYKLVPVMLAEQCEWFGDIARHTRTLVDVKWCAFWSKDLSVLSPYDSKFLNEYGTYHLCLAVTGLTQHVRLATQLIDQAVSAQTEGPSLHRFLVTHSQVSSLLGPKGVSVRAVERESGARVRVERTTRHAHLVSVEVSGTGQEMRLAHRAIARRLRQERPPPAPHYSSEDDEDGHCTPRPLSPLPPDQVTSTAPRLALSQPGDQPHLVVVSHIHSPDLFHVRPAQADSLDCLRADLAHWLAQSGQSECRTDPPQVGHMVAVRDGQGEGHWRARVAQVDGDRARVELVDVGRSEWHSLHSLAHLPPAFTRRLAPQAVQCALASTGHWSHSQTDTFRRLCGQGQVALRCLALLPDQHTHSVALFKTLPDRTVLVGAALASHSPLPDSQ